MQQNSMHTNKTQSFPQQIQQEIKRVQTERLLLQLQHAKMRLQQEQLNPRLHPLYGHPQLLDLCSAQRSQQQLPPTLQPAMTRLFAEQQQTQALKDFYGSQLQVNQPNMGIQSLQQPMSQAPTRGQFLRELTQKFLDRQDIRLAQSADPNFKEAVQQCNNILNPNQTQLGSQSIYPNAPLNDQITSTCGVPTSNQTQDQHVRMHMNEPISQGGKDQRLTQLLDQLKQSLAHSKGTAQAQSGAQHIQTMESQSISNGLSVKNLQTDSSELTQKQHLFDALSKINSTQDGLNSPQSDKPSEEPKRPTAADTPKNEKQDVDSAEVVKNNSKNEAQEDSDMDDQTISENLSNEDSLGSQVSKHQQHLQANTFAGIPKEWHETIKVKNSNTQRVKLFFKCKYPGCNSIFKKSCNLRDHFRKHTGQRPFTCTFCHKTFTQSGNLGRHLKNVHQVPRGQQELIKQQCKTGATKVTKKKICKTKIVAKRGANCADHDHCHHHENHSDYDQKEMQGLGLAEEHEQNNTHCDSKTGRRQSHEESLVKVNCEQEQSPLQLQNFQQRQESQASSLTQQPMPQILLYDQSVANQIQNKHTILKLMEFGDAVQQLQAGFSGALGPCADEAGDLILDP